MPIQSHFSNAASASASASARISISVSWPFQIIIILGVSGTDGPSYRPRERSNSPGPNGQGYEPIKYFQQLGVVLDWRRSRTEHCRSRGSDSDRVTLLELSSVGMSGIGPQQSKTLLAQADAPRCAAMRRGTLPASVVVRGSPDHHTRPLISLLSAVPRARRPHHFASLRLHAAVLPLPAHIQICGFSGSIFAATGSWLSLIKNQPSGSETG